MQMAEMRQPKPILLVVAISLGALACTVAGDGGMPLVTAITKDPSTLLYTVSTPVIKNGGTGGHHPLVLDLSGPVIWSTCPTGYVVLGCTRTASTLPTASTRATARRTPTTPGGDTASDDMTEVTLFANATDGKTPLYAVQFLAAKSCAPDSLLAKLAQGAVGVAGLARSIIALPAQVAHMQKVANKFALCLPSGDGAGVAIFGGGPLFLLPPERPDMVASLVGYTPLRKHGESPGYYISADKGIAVNHIQVPLDGHGNRAAPVLIGLSSTAPYTALRPDVYRAFITAFDKATSEMARIKPAVAPFELCYDSAKLGSTRVGYAVPQIDLMLEGGKNWTLFGGNSMSQVNDHTACLAFVEMKGEDEKAGYGGRGTEAPAAVIGGFQMEDNLLVFDEEKKRLGFSSLLLFRQTTCSNFNFTMSA